MILVMLRIVQRQLADVEHVKVNLNSLLFYAVAQQHFMITDHEYCSIAVIYYIKLDYHKATFI